MPPARVAAAESRRVREESGVAFTGHLTEPTLHYPIGPLMQVSMTHPNYLVSRGQMLVRRHTCWLSPFRH